MPEAVKTTTTLKNKGADYLKGLERHLKELWSQYVKRLDESGFDETAKFLKERYLNVYRCYRGTTKNGENGAHFFEAMPRRPALRAGRDVL